MIITLDGGSGTGKSTLASMLAKKINFKCLNTGMIYRCITYYFVTKNILPNCTSKIEHELNNMNLKITFKQDKQHVLINNHDITPHINAEEVQQNVAYYSQILPVRQKVHEVQLQFAKNNNIVVEGRDIGTEIFPDAEHKFFIECDINVRAKRRYEDLKKEGSSLTLEQVVESLKLRDLSDTNRKISPLKKPVDAVVINTSNCTIDESVNELLSHIKI